MRITAANARLSILKKRPAVVTGGGYPRGRVIEIFGPESSGKTTLALHAIAEVQRTGGISNGSDNIRAQNYIMCNLQAQLRL